MTRGIADDFEAFNFPIQAEGLQLLRICVSSENVHQALTTMAQASKHVLLLASLTLLEPPPIAGPSWQRSAG